MREVIRFINPYEPGIFPEDLSIEAVQLGSNENPYEPSDEVKRAYLESLKTVNRYPKPDYRILKEAISEYIGFPVENIAVGCGASELIQSICNVIIEELDRVVVPMPSYSLYILYAMLRNASISFPVFEGYDVKADVIAEDEPKLTFLCSPNNPTGNTVERKVVKEVTQYSEYVVVDETYVEFSDKSCVDLAGKMDNLIVIRSFSKYFGLAGMRVGYAVCSEKIAEAIEKVRLPFAISYPALKMAIAAIKSRDYYESVREKIVSERERIFSELSKIRWLKPYPSEANFILVKVDLNDLKDLRDSEDSEKSLIERLLEKGIIVRDASVMGLDGEHLRITVGKKEENDKLLQALEF